MKTLRITILLDGDPIRMQVIQLNGRAQITAEALASNLSVNATAPSFITVVIEEIKQ